MTTGPSLHTAPPVPPGRPDRAAVEREILALIAAELDEPGDGSGVPTRAARPDAHLRDDLGLDSLHLVAVQVAVEDRFGVAFDPMDEQLADAFRTVAGLARYVEYLLRERA